MAETIRILQQDHQNLAHLLKALERQIVRFEGNGEADFDIVQGILEYCLNYPDLCHHPKEDAVLRRLIDRDPKAEGMIGDLEGEHRKLADSTRHFASALHQLLAGHSDPQHWFCDTARSFLERYWQHMEMEETIFFPIALQELTAEDWRKVDEEVANLVDPMFGGKVEERYKVLRNEILMWDEIDT